MEEGGPSRQSLLAAAGPQLADIVELCLDAAQQTIGHLQGPQARAAHAAVLLAAQRAAQAPGPPFLAVLEACGLRLEEAVRELGPAAAALEAPLAGVLGGSPPLAQRLQLRELQQAYVLLTLLMKKARDLFGEYFLLPADSRDPGSALGFFWQLFCTARAALLPPQADLVTSFALLLACTHFMLRHVPAQHQRSGGGGKGGADDGLGTQQQQQLQQQQAGQHSSAAAAGVDLLTSVAASHSAADHIGTVRQLAGLLDQLARQVLLPVVAAGQPNGGEQEGEVQAANGTPFLLIRRLFDATGQPYAAALQALRLQQQQLAGPVDIEATALLTAASPATHGRSTAAVPGAAAPAQASTAAAQTPAAAAAAAAEAHLASAAALLGSGAEEGQAVERMAVDAPSPAAPAMAAEPAGPAAELQPQQQEQQQHLLPQQPQLEVEQEGGKAAESPRSPAKRPLAAGEEEGEPDARAVGGSDASYRTPSPAKRQRPVQALQAHPTPISAALSSTAWLRGALAGQPAGPSETMQALIRSAGLTHEAEARLVATAQAMATAVFPDPTGQLEGPLAALEQSTVAARRAEGLKLYWRALEGLVAAEGARPDASPGGGASLLAAPAFHRCVAACSFELVAAAYRVGTLAFPAVLERLRLPAFDLCKVLEPFVQQVPSLPRDLRRHLLSVEEQCLESLAWQPGSSLYTSMVAAVGGSSGGTTANGGGGAAAGEGSHIGQAPAAPPNQQQPPQPPQPPQQQPQQQPPSQQQQQQQQPQPQPQQQPQAKAQAGSPSHSKADSSERAAGAAAAERPGTEDAAGAAGTAGTAGAADAMSADDDMAAAGGSQAPGAAGTHCAEGRLPLHLGHEPPAAAPAAAAGGEQQAQHAAAAAAAGQHAAEIARGDRGARAAVAEFLRRVLKLCAIRLADLLSRLDCRPADLQLLLAEAYTLAQHVCFEQSWLLYGRHLDQILLCCLYSICKVHHLGQASFKSIIAAYKQQPQARPDTFKSVSMTPRERTSLHSMGGPPHADIIAFYNQVFLPHTKPFLLRLAESRSLLAQPPASVLPYLLASHGQPQLQHQLVQGSTTPPPPAMLLRGMQPASLQHTPFRPGTLAGSGSGWPSPAPPPLHPQARGLVGTPTRGSGGAAARSLQLRSPGAWRISRGQMTPVLPSPQLVSLTPGFSPGGLHPGFLHGAPPLSMAAIHSMFGVPGGGAGSMPAAPVPTLPALPAKAAEPQLPPAAVPAVPPPLVSDAAVQAMFASAEAAAAAAAAAGAAGAAALPAVQPAEEAVLDTADMEELHQLSALPSESLPLLAAAAAVAEEIEQREREVAEAFSRRAAQLAGAGLVPPLPAAAAATAGQPEQPEAEAAPPQLLQLPQPAQQQQQPMLSPARHARRVLSLQPAAPPLQ